MIQRRSFISAILAAGVAPAYVASGLMKGIGIIVLNDGICLPSISHPYGPAVFQGDVFDYDEISRRYVIALSKSMRDTKEYYSAKYITSINW